MAEAAKYKLVSRPPVLLDSGRGEISDLFCKYTAVLIIDDEPSISQARPRLKARSGFCGAELRPGQARCKGSGPEVKSDQARPQMHPI